MIGHEEHTPAPTTTKRVLITGGAGQIAYALLPHLISGRVFGPQVRLIVHLLDIPGTENALRGVQMEIEDAASPVVVGVVPTTDLRVAFTGVDYAILLGGFPRLPGMERKELLAKNVEIITTHAAALDDYASRDVKVLVVANPANTLALVAKKRASSLPVENFSCLTRLDHDRLRGMVAKKLTSLRTSSSTTDSTSSTSSAAVTATQVRNAVIWGNHSSTQVPSAAQAQVELGGKWVSIHEVLQAKDAAWLHGELVTSVQQRGAEILAARKLSSALSAAQAIANHFKDWVHGTAEGEFVSMGVFVSEGNAYDIPADIFFSFPVTCKGGKWTVVQGLSLSEETRKRLPATITELVEERNLALSLVGGASHL
jgi:malate dehydrogenase